MNIGLLSSVSAIALVGYTGAVIYNGQLINLLSQMTKDWQFLEFIAALGILYYLAKQDYLSGPVTALIGLAAAGFLLRVVANPQATTAVKSFANGSQGLFQTLYDVAKNIKGGFSISAPFATN